MVEIKNLKKSYGGKAVVSDLSIKIESGSVFGFLGRNGAGKTTAIKVMVGITVPDSGEVLVGGKNSQDLSARENVGFMPEAPYFYDRLTGLEFLRFCGSLFKRREIPPQNLHNVSLRVPTPRSGRGNLRAEGILTRLLRSFLPRNDDDAARRDGNYLDALKKMGIYDARNRPINTYSKGMKQRLGFAQVMVNDPDYVFLDEPLDGLDPIGRREMKKIILELKSRGKTVFFNSHILYDTEEICDAIGVIDEGKLLYSGGVKEFCRGEPLEERFVKVVERKI